MKKVYLRVNQEKRRFNEIEIFELFEGDIKKDRKYWKKYHKNIDVRYFELKEIK